MTVSPHFPPTGRLFTFTKQHPKIKGKRLLLSLSQQQSAPLRTLMLEVMEQVAEWTPKLFYWAILVFVAYLIIRAALAYRDLLMNLIDMEY